MRQNPQVILFGEMRNKEEIENALRLAETGHLVLSTLHTRSAYQTISRILDAFESDQQAQLRVQLADSIVAVLSQRLLKVSDGTGVKLVKEIMVKKTEYIFTLELKEGVNTFKLLAHNEGKTPPNTAAILIDDGKKEYKRVLSSKKDEFAELKIVLE